MNLESLIGPLDINIFITSLVRIVAAVSLGGLIGYNREKKNKPAGLRSNALMCLGTMLFVFIPSLATDNVEAISRYGQGIGAFLGALALGTVLKRDREMEVVGLTTAISFVPVAGIGIAIAYGYLWLAVLIATTILFVFKFFDISEALEDKSDK